MNALSYAFGEYIEFCLPVEETVFVNPVCSGFFHASLSPNRFVASYIVGNKSVVKWGSDAPHQAGLGFCGQLDGEISQPETEGCEAVPLFSE